MKLSYGSGRFYLMNLQKMVLGGTPADSEEKKARPGSLDMKTKHRVLLPFSLQNQCKSQNAIPRQVVLQPSPHQRGNLQKGSVSYCLTHHPYPVSVIRPPSITSHLYPIALHTQVLYIAFQLDSSTATCTVHSTPITSSCPRYPQIHKIPRGERWGKSESWEGPGRGKPGKKQPST